MIEPHIRFRLAAAALVSAIGAHPDAELTQHISGAPIAAAPIDSAILNSYKWRSIGPDRGGRSIAATGIR